MDSPFPFSRSPPLTPPSLGVQAGDLYWNAGETAGSFSIGGSEGARAK